MLNDAWYYLSTEWEERPHDACFLFFKLNFHSPWQQAAKELLKCSCALGLLANLKETRKVKWACRVKATSIVSVVKE